MFILINPRKVLRLFIIRWSFNTSKNYLIGEFPKCYMKLILQSSMCICCILKAAKPCLLMRNAAVACVNL